MAQIPRIVSALTLYSALVIGLSSAQTQTNALTSYGPGSLPTGLALDAAGNLYIADSYNGVKRVDAITRAVTNVAGGPYTSGLGDGGPATAASLNWASDVKLDAAGNLYIAESFGNRIRKVTTAGIITTIAGNGTQGFSGDGGAATTATIYAPTALAVDSAGNVYFSDTNNSRIRRIDAATGIIQTFAGNGVIGYSGDGGPATLASFRFVTGLALDSAGNLYAADSGNLRVRRIDAASGIITTFAGSGAENISGDGASALNAGLNVPAYLAFDANGNLLITNGLLPATYAYAGSGTLPPPNPEIPTIPVPALDGRVRRVDMATGLIWTVAGGGVTFTPGYPASSCFNATDCYLNQLGGVVASPSGAIFAGEQRGGGVRRIMTPVAIATTALQFSATTTPGAATTLKVTLLSSSGSPAAATMGFNVYRIGAGGYVSQGPLVGGTATVSVPDLPVGTHTLRAYYIGDANFGVAWSDPINIVQNPWIKLVSTPNPAPSDLGFSVNTTIIPTTATGTVTYFDGGTQVAVKNLNNGQAGYYSLPNPTPGTHIMTVTYSGDGTTPPMTSAPLTQVVNLVSSVSLTSDTLGALVGQPVTFTATVAPSTATGVVVFSDNGTTIGSANINSGIATFTTSTLATGDRNIKATYTGDANNTSANRSITQSVKVPSILTLVSNLNPAPPGHIHFTVAVSPVTLTGTVELREGTTVLANGNPSSGTITFDVWTLSSGTHNLAATFAGDANITNSASPVLSQIIKAVSTATLVSSVSPSNPGQSVTLTATISPAAATGSMEFHDGATVLGQVPLTTGSAALPISTLSGGNHSLYVVYSGDAADNGSTSSAVTQVVKYPITMTLQSSANPSIYGSAVTITVTTAPSSATGSIQVMEGSTVLGTGALSGGMASFTASGLAQGTHAINAVYSGDATYGPFTSAPLTQTVNNKTATTTSIAATPNPSTLGSAVTVTATISPSAATGTIQFLDGATVIGTASLNAGTASMSTSSLTAGSHSITAIYSGSATHLGSTSSALTQTISIPLPGAPSNLTATAAGSSQINLALTASSTSGVTYNIYRATTNGFTPSAANRIATGVATNSFASTGLAGSTAYYFRVTAVNAGGESAATNQANATTTGLTACHVVYSVPSQWNNGFTGAVTIQNTGSTPITSWNLTWTWDKNQKITSAWNAGYTQTGANAKLTYMSYNATIAPGATLSGVGFNGSFTGQNPTPTVFYVNGTLCN